MTDRHSNEEFNFGSLASSFADEPAPKKESAGPAKITKANVAATAPAVEAAVPAVEPASAPALPPMPNPPMPPMPEVQNPAKTGDFWSGALTSALPTLIGTGTGAGIAYALLKRNQKNGGGGGGQGLQAPPAVDEDLRQLRLAQEQAKLESMYAKEARQQELHAANLARSQPAAQTVAPSVQAAPTGLPSTTQQFSVSGQPQPTVQYGQQKTNAPTGVPSPIPAPAGQAAAVQPPPMSDLERIRLEKAQVELENAKAKAAREQQLHEKRLADMEARSAKKDAEKLSKLQGQSSAEVNMQKSSIRAGEEKSAEAAVRATTKQYPPVAGAPVEPKAIAEPIKGTNVAVASQFPPETPPTTEKQPVIPSVAAVEESKKRRTAAEIAAEKEQKPFTGARNQLITNLGGQYGEEGKSAAKEALSIAKKRVFGGEKVAMEPGTGKVTEHWAKIKEDILANPSEYPKFTVEHIQKGAEKAKAEAQAKKAAAALMSGGGGMGGPVIRGGGGGSTGIGRAGEEIHNLNPLKL